MSDLWAALDNQTVDTDITSRTVRFQGRRGSSMVHVVNILKEKGWTTEDIIVFASGPLRSSNYDVVFDDQAKCKAFFSSTNGHVKYCDAAYDITLQ
ncbi:hypothetical protein DPMN_139798 [Dreissena polymorpha]|uniref:Uncharacterized protein n=1 Tax=Dreissena polymorpha TaxID=45954 RepID=A0A9D4G6J3_DREPO|nr:hypothetical protein DPMN_139798 [Dreissena polymorpha]